LGRYDREALPLTPRAEVRAAPAQADALDGRAAARAGLAGAPEDGQVLQMLALLPRSVAVLGVTQARPPVADGRGQHLADGSVQADDLLRGEAARRPSLGFAICYTQLTICGICAIMCVDRVA